MVTVYTTGTCANCQMVKKYLSVKKVEYKEVDISSDNTLREKIFNMTGLTMVPVITKDEKFVVGWNIPELSKLIA